ncbi:hypothetical protein BDV39DRAFT_180767 [Aspergillus sergii]|uniref:Uncharacterized protein n=1 Tax=Aspergillus sergii TaxID=1034303 RepID=A0A5N6WWF8_9EURO|nr:hypothetical protein BDV39DRAFT_180767 [Aspergillus sergii]
MGLISALLETLSFTSPGPGAQVHGSICGGGSQLGAAGPLSISLSPFSLFDFIFILLLFAPLFW